MSSPQVGLNVDTPSNKPLVKEKKSMFGILFQKRSPIQQKLSIPLPKYQ